MKTYFLEDPLYRERFSNVRLRPEWAATRPDFDGADTGIDLVAEEREGGFCAVQCKCHAPGTQISKPHPDSFIAASARDPFTDRIVVDTGDGWGPNARKTIERLKPACTALARFRTHYRDNAIIRDAIFEYVYGLLHAPGYRERFANDPEARGEPKP